MTYLSLYKLTYREAIKLHMRDLYSLHRIVWDLFPVDDPRQKPNRILFADKCFRRGIRSILIQSGTPPRLNECGEIKTRTIPEGFLDMTIYRFEIVVNAAMRIHKTEKLVPLVGRPAIESWFRKKSPRWGFESFDLEVEETEAMKFYKGSRQLTINQARILGVLRVLDRDKFIDSCTYGIGRARAFGCGLLQLVPASSATL